jgi:hypothetical protein
MYEMENMENIENVENKNSSLKPPTRFKMSPPDRNIKSNAKRLCFLWTYWIAPIASFSS